MLIQDHADNTANQVNYKQCVNQTEHVKFKREMYSSPCLILATYSQIKRTFTKFISKMSYGHNPDHKIFHFFSPKNILLLAVENYAVVHYTHSQLLVII